MLLINNEIIKNIKNMNKINTMIIFKRNTLYFNDGLKFEYYKIILLPFWGNLNSRPAYITNSSDGGFVAQLMG